MNIRKPIDYSAMFTALDALIAAELPQMKLYCKIGRLVSDRPEKGAAVAAAEYLQRRYPEASGFSPRNLRRMRNFYRLYENAPQLMEQALHLSWTQNVVIMEADLSMEERAWYLRACFDYGWSKSELQSQIDSGVHLEVSLDQFSQAWYNDLNGEQETRVSGNDESAFYLPRQYMQKSDGRVHDERLGKESGAGEGFPDRLRSDQHRGDRKPGLSSCPPQAGRAWDTSARQLTNRDYDAYDLLIGMDQANLRNMYRICGGDYAGKMHLLMDFTDRPGDVADPWYTDDFEATWRDVEAGCRGLLKELTARGRNENG